MKSCTFFAHIIFLLYLCSAKAFYPLMTDEIVLYQPNDQLSIEVKLENETVWLNRNQIALLFDRDVKTIGKHITNALREELSPTVAKNATVQSDENPTVAKFAIVQREGARDVVRQIEYYSLDVILSVGYRVKSSRGIEFRRWANKVLKEYMLRGYAVNQQLLHLEERIDHRFQALEQRVAKTEEQVDFFVRTSLPPVEQVFFNGEFFEARVLLEKIIKTAKKRVIIIDAYVDAATFDMLDVRAKGVKADIYSGVNLSKLQKLHNDTAGLEPIYTHIWKHASHDRWIIADDNLYHCGPSLKDAGQKLGAVSLLSIDAEDILKHVR